MGFKFKRVDILAGSESFPSDTTSSTTYAKQLLRSKTILSSIVDAIISTGTGWALDTSRNASSTDFADVPCSSGSNTFPGLFLTNTQSTCKMFIAYFGGNYLSACTIKNFDGNSLYRYRSDNDQHISGVCVSIIPAGSSNNFGSSFDSTFLPSDATRIVGTAMGYDVSSYAAYGYAPANNMYYSWGIYINNTTISITASNSVYETNTAKKPHLPQPVYAVGKIFKSVEYYSDAILNLKYGIVLFHHPNNNMAYEGWGGDLSVDGYVAGEQMYLPGVNFVSDTNNAYTHSKACGCVSNINGTWINGTDESTYCVQMYTQNPQLLSSKTCSKQNTVRWCRLSIVVVTSNLSTYGVTSNDGFKGYLDTDLFRASVAPHGTVFDNGKMIQCGEDNICNMSYGWDSSNTDTVLAET